MKRQVQQSFLGKGFIKPEDSFGGSLLKGNPKGKRPMDSKLPIQLTMRANRSVLRLHKTLGPVNEIIRTTAKKHGVKVYDFANVGNHIHAVIKIFNLQSWPAFIRELTGRIAQVVGELVNYDNDKGFWLYRPHTRIVRGWQKAFKIAKRYIYLNQLEAEGFISRKESKTLRDLKLICGDG